VIAGALVPGAEAPVGVVALRRATVLDAGRVLAWNNAADVRARSIDPRPIAADDHARWFAGRLGDPHGRFWIVLLDATPIGVVRIDREREPSLGRISIVLDPSVRGRGLGRRVIGLACAADGGPIVAEILADNLVSRTAFEAAGFVRQPDPPAAAGAAPPALRPLVRYLWRPARVPHV
jgi:RimJ/RimL family protein N-acetyltransferase